MRPKTLALAIAAFCISACDVRIEPRDVARCDLRIYPIRTDLPGDEIPRPENDVFHIAQTLADGSEGTTFEQIIEDALNPVIMVDGNPRVRPNNLLFLSGGSHNGSYGAGYLLGWAENQRTAVGEEPRPGRLPSFSLVTGISTGSILATPAFLGDHTSGFHTFSQIDHEKQLLTPYVRMKPNGDISKRSYLSIVKYSAVADLTPLKGWLRSYLYDKDRKIDRLEQVAARAKEGRLLIGVVDVESGKAVAVDMTHLASRYSEAKRLGLDARADNARECYINTIVASSSAPLAARPVFINNRTYVDGGVRYGVFATGIQTGVKTYFDKSRTGRQQFANLAGPLARKPHVFVIFHGTQIVKPWCDQDTELSACDAFKDPRDIPEHPRESWNLAGLGMRSIEVMVNQLQRSSVKEIESNFASVLEPGHFHYTQIRPEHLKFRMTMQVGTEEVTKTCEGWHEFDQHTLRPVQFHPHYMKCLIAAGRAQGQQADWPVH